MDHRKTVDLNWIDVRNEKPEVDKEVFVLYHSKYYDSLAEINNNSHCPEINVGIWEEESDDFIDAHHQYLGSYHWMPIICQNKKQELDCCQKIDKLKELFDALHGEFCTSWKHYDDLCDFITTLINEYKIKCSHHN